MEYLCQFQEKPAPAIILKKLSRLECHLCFLIEYAKMLKLPRSLQMILKAAIMLPVTCLKPDAKKLFTWPLHLLFPLIIKEWKVLNKLYLIVVPKKIQIISFPAPAILRGIIRSF